MECVARLGVVTQKEPGRLGVEEDRAAFGGLGAVGLVHQVVVRRLVLAQGGELLGDHLAEQNPAAVGFGDEVGRVHPSKPLGELGGLEEPAEGVVRGVLIAEEVVQPCQPGLGLLTERRGLGAFAQQADRLVALVGVPVSGLGQHAVEFFPAGDEPAPAVPEPAEPSDRGGRVGLQLLDQDGEFLVAVELPADVGLADLSSEHRGMMPVRAVGHQGRGHALVDQVLRRGAVGPVVDVPRLLPGRDHGRVLVRQRDDLGTQPVPQGVEPRAVFPLLRPRPSGFAPVLSADLGALLGGDGHRSCSLRARRLAWRAFSGFQASLPLIIVSEASPVPPRTKVGSEIPAGFLLGQTSWVWLQWTREAHSRTG
ncbi:MAG: hypothetical protein U0835_10530 [Isosphaeraceae bacterium]